MRGFLILLAAIGCPWAVDVFAFDGRYSEAVLQEANFQSQRLYYEVERWLKKANF